MKNSPFPTIDKNLTPLIESELEGIKHGIVTVSIHIRDGKISRYVTNREKSMLASELLGGRYE